MFGIISSRLPAAASPAYQGGELHLFIEKAAYPKLAAVDDPVECADEECAPR